MHLASVAEGPRTTIQIIPASAGAHAGLLGAFVIAVCDGLPCMVYRVTYSPGSGSRQFPPVRDGQIDRGTWWPGRRAAAEQRR
jgi:hypothetical protein